MAPRFTHRMYQTYKTSRGTDALIGLPFSEIDLIFQIRDSLSNKICESNDMFLHKAEGKPTPADSDLLFFPKQHEKTVQDFFTKKAPGILSLRKKASYLVERLRIIRLAQIRIETSHDFPCIIIGTSIHSENKLSEIIDSVSKQLDIELPKNNKLGPIRNIVMSNRSFSL
jgi:hypothetical protein